MSCSPPLRCVLCSNEALPKLRAPWLVMAVMMMMMVVAPMLSWLWRVMCGANCREDIIGTGPLGRLKVAAASVAFVLITPGCIWWGASKLTPYVFLLVDPQ